MSISKENLKDLYDSPEKAARIADLIYVTDKHLTIHRRKEGEHFTYTQNGKPLSEKKILDRIENLTIPPAWQEVLIAEPPNGHLQAVGRDDKERKVYLYHDTWNKLRNETKFFKMAAFANVLPQIRQQVDADLDDEKMTQRKVLALIIRLMEETHIRVGNETYARRNQTYGLSTMRTRHLKNTDNGLRFQFIGKKGKEQDVAVTDQKLIDLINRCEEIPGWELFKYYDENGNKETVDSSMINDYIHEISGDLFSAKDFRTWSATKIFFESLRETGYTDEESENKKNRIAAYDTAANALGNTREVCRSYYIHPVIPESYQDGSIVPYFDKVDQNASGNQDFLSQTEKVIKEMLAKYEIEL